LAPGKETNQLFKGMASFQIEASASFEVIIKGTSTGLLSFIN
jgi:hypothetical protein